MGIEKHSLRESVEANARLALAFFAPISEPSLFPGEIAARWDGPRAARRRRSFWRKAGTMR
jgi:hypothetical protein